MFLAPPLPPEVKRRGMLFRVLSTVGLGTTAFLLVVANVILWLACYFAIDPKVTPQQLYHNTWQAVKDNVYDQSKLANWDDWEHKYDGQIKTDEDAIRFASEMVDSLHDRYTFMLTPASVQADKQRADGKFIGIGVTLGGRVDSDGKPLPEDGHDGYPVVKSVIHGGPAESAGLQGGDVILGIDGRDTNGLDTEQIVALIRGESGAAVTLRVRSQGKEVTLTIVRGPVNISIASAKRLPKQQLPAEIGYVRLETFDQWDTADEMEAAIKQLSTSKALIIDVRDNPGGFIHSALLVSAMFLDHGTITTESQRLPDIGYVTVTYGVTHGAFSFKTSWGPFTNVPLKAPWRPDNLAGDRPVVLLVNGGTASAAELFTAALQDNRRATVVGTRTFGKGIGQVYVPVGNGARLRITNIHGFTPSGRFIGDGGNTTAFGITPDVVVEPNAGMHSGEEDDNQLAAAVDLLKKKLAP